MSSRYEVQIIRPQDGKPKAFSPCDAELLAAAIIRKHPEAARLIREAAP